MFCTRVAWVCLVCLLLCKEEGTSPGSLQLLRGGIWDRDYVSQLPCVRYYVFLLRAVLNILVSLVRAYVF